MRIVFSFILLSLSDASFGQKTDTVFLERKIGSGPDSYYHAVFIDTSSTYRTALTDFSFKGNDSAEYFSSIKHIEPLNKEWFNGCESFPRRWIAAYKLKGSYYLYYPSDFGNHYTFEFTDSSVISHDMEGPSAGKGVLLRCNLPSVVEFNMTIYSSVSTVRIHIFDIDRGIALFEFSSQTAGGATFRKFMVDAGKADQFPTIVNYCKTQKVKEYVFDSVAPPTPTD